MTVRDREKKFFLVPEIVEIEKYIQKLYSNNNFWYFSIYTYFWINIHVVGPFLFLYSRGQLNMNVATRKKLIS